MLKQRLPNSGLTGIDSTVVFQIDVVDQVDEDKRSMAAISRICASFASFDAVILKTIVRQFIARKSAAGGRGRERGGVCPEAPRRLRRIKPDSF